MIAEVELASTWRSVHSPTNPPLLTLGIFQRVHPVFIVDKLEVDAQNRGAWAIGSRCSFTQQTEPAGAACRACAALLKNEML